MKKTILIIVLIFSGALIAQSWNNIVTTTISEPNLVQLENFANRDGMERMYLIYVCLSLILLYKAFRVLLLKNHSCSFCLEHSKLNIYFYPTGFT